jgi:transcriptional regulator with XRE-family HTH domain
VNKLAALISAERAARGWSLQELANKVGCAKPHIWDMERGHSTNPTLHTLCGLARAFDMKPSDLVARLTNEKH